MNIDYEMSSSRHLYKYVPPRPLEKIDVNLDKVSREIMVILREVHA